jgi:hypothetical protein
MSSAASSDIESWKSGAKLAGFLKKVHVTWYNHKNLSAALSILEEDYFKEKHLPQDVQDLQDLSCTR